MKSKGFGKNAPMLALMVLGVFIFGSLVYADATLVDNLNVNGTANTSFGLYDNGSLVLGQEEQMNGTLNRTRVINIETADDELRNYVQSKEGEWSTSLLNDQSLANLIGQSVDYLEGREYTSGVADDIGNSLDSYFASDNDVQQLLKMIDDLQKKTMNLNVRVVAIERTLEETASEDYCNAKLETAEKYNMTIKGLKCGLNSTYYYETPTGMMTIETYDPNVDSKPVKMTMIVPLVIFADTPFTAGIMLNNTGTKFGAYKVLVEVPEGWTADQIAFSGTIADMTTEMLYVKITPGKNSGTLKAGAKIVLSGKTYKLLATSDITPVKLEEPVKEVPVQEEKQVLITANLISTFGNSMSGFMEASSETIKNISGNLSEIIENVSNNMSSASVIFGQEE